MYQLRTLQLLAVLKDKLFEEEPILLFDYFGMHKRSIEILRLIKAKEHSNSSSILPSSICPQRHSYPTWFF